MSGHLPYNSTVILEPLAGLQVAGATVTHDVDSNRDIHMTFHDGTHLRIFITDVAERWEEQGNVKAFLTITSPKGEERRIEL